MKFLHISDLHIGKRLNEFSMLEDQKHILNKILETAVKEQADGVLIAGDIYDKPVPSAEAVRVFDTFLTALADRQIQVFQAAWLMMAVFHEVRFSPSGRIARGRIREKIGKSQMLGECSFAFLPLVSKIYLLLLKMHCYSLVWLVSRLRIKNEVFLRYAKTVPKKI